jgi:hypothetical protein
MIRDRPTAAFVTLTDSVLYPIVLLLVMAATAGAFVSGWTYVGVAGVFTLSLLSLSYGAVRTVDDIP